MSRYIGGPFFWYGTVLYHIFICCQYIVNLRFWIVSVMEECWPIPMLVVKSSSLLMSTRTFFVGIQKEHLKNLIPSMTHLVRCHDTYEPLSGFNLARGQTGVSISWPSDWSSKVKQLPDGNERNSSGGFCLRHVSQKHWIIAAVSDAAKVSDISSCDSE
jgi:hypothetical protein